MENEQKLVLSYPNLENLLELINWVYPYLIPDSERGLISAVIMPITTLLVVVERKLGLFHPSLKP
jgi:hypothetical protein